jgi:hypothetical protein
VLPRGDGGYLVAGTYGEYRPSTDIDDLWLASLDPDGAIDWQKRIGNTFMDETGRIALHEEGLVITGEHATSLTGVHRPDVLVARLGLDGTFTGTCSWVNDAAAIAFEVTTPFTVTGFETRNTDGVIVDAHSTFTNADLPVTRMCPE